MGPANETEVAAAEWPGGRHESSGIHRTNAFDSVLPRQVSADDTAGGTQHEGRHGRVRENPGDRLRGDDCARHSEGNSLRSQGDRSLSRRRLMAVMLELKNVSSGYGAIEALKGINIRIDQGEIVTLIGANGAGKSTTLRNI